MFGQKTPKDVVINAVKPGFKSKTVTDKLWADLNLENNEILKQVPEISKNLYTMLNDYQDVFTNDTCHVGKTSWETFKIELLPDARPVNQRGNPCRRKVMPFKGICHCLWPLAICPHAL